MIHVLKVWQKGIKRVCVMLRPKAAHSTCARRRGRVGGGGEVEREGKREGEVEEEGEGKEEGEEVG